MIIYVVQNGDTVYSVAERYSVSPLRLASDNGLELWDTLVVGQTLVVLIPKTAYTILPGDTLYSIAEKFGTDVITLLRNNPQINNGYVLYPGSEIVIAYNDTPLGTMLVNGYAYPYINNLTLRQTLPYLSSVIVFTYGINDNGTLISINDGNVISAAEEYGVTPVMLIATLNSEGVFSNELAHNILNDEAKTEILIENITKNIIEKGYGGLDVDFEFVYPEDSDAYVNFVSRLAERLNPLGHPVIVALAPKTSDDQPGLLYEGHNYAELGAAANYVLLMTYEWGYTYSPPMAVAPINSVRRVLDYAITRIPPDKIFMGIPNYGYDWPLPYEKGITRATSISNAEAVSIARRYGAEIMYDETVQSPYFNYTDENGIAHEVWFEDARSIEAKLKTALEYGFAGVSYWNLDRPFPQNWLVVNNLYNIARFG